MYEEFNINIENFPRRKSKSPSAKKSKTPIDLSQCLPTKLHERVSKIIHIPPLHENAFEEIKKLSFSELLQELDPVLLKKLQSSQEEINESNFAEMIEKHQARRSIELNIEPRLSERPLNLGVDNWISGYIKKLKKERIVWQTKLFKDNKEIHEKPLFEQTEELIDIAADCFAKWLKNMDEESNINKEFVKQLFSIQVESDASKALYVEPKEINVIPHDVANLLGLSQFSVQNNVFKIKKMDKKKRKQKPQTVAFGRSLPLSLRKIKFNEDLFDELYKINCPEELRSLKCVFDGILHLRSTRALVEHLKNHPELPRSKFLIQHKMFDDKTPTKKSLRKPFWSHFY